MVCIQTGYGKTTAFIVPTLGRMLEMGGPPPPLHLPLLLSEAIAQEEDFFLQDWFSFQKQS